MPNHGDRPMSEGGGETEREVQTGGGREMTGREGGRWRGWVMPYRYSGPGYAGWGYYSVLYHGPEAQGDEEESWTREDVGREGGQGQAGMSGSGYGGYGGGGAYGEDREGGFDPGGRSPWGETSFEQGEGGRGGQYAGQYAGRGPRGYRRSDDRLKEEVCERLTDHGWVDASDIEVDVRDGEVTLRGTVSDRRMKRLAADLADEIRGVQDVHNELKLRRDDGGSQAQERAGQQTGDRAAQSAEEARTSRQRKGETGSRSGRGGSRSGSAARGSGEQGGSGEQATQQG